MRLTGRNYKLLKMVMDILISFAGIFVLWPFILLLVLFIKLGSPGNPIFRQIRVGINGKRFVFYKFRTMVKNAEELKPLYAHLNEAGRPLFKIANDPRMTSLGRYLRKTNLDELPQLFNVLKGDMSLVGPRPNLPEEVAQYEAWQKKRLIVKPGMTSLWHTTRYNIKAEFGDWVKSDIYYIDNRNLSLDLKIILATIKLIVKRIIYNWVQ